MGESEWERERKRARLIDEPEREREEQESRQANSGKFSARLEVTSKHRGRTVAGGGWGRSLGRFGAGFEPLQCSLFKTHGAGEGESANSPLAPSAKCCNVAGKRAGKGSRRRKIMGDKV